MAYQVEEIGLNPNYPLLTPAASAMYVRHCSNAPTPICDQLNWFSPSNTKLYHGAALYSAGHAHLDPNKCRDKEGMIANRDRSTTILISDSGGYQIGTGVFSGGETFRKDIHGRQADKIRSRIIAWSEEFSDYSMTIDYPTWALGAPNYLFSLFQECLDETLYNCAFIENERTYRKSRFLNVIQGQNIDQAVAWYNAVKEFEFEGWSFAGPVAANPDVTVRIILHLWKDRSISADRNWIHILGRSSLKAVWVNNILHRCIKKYICPTAQISYDSSSTVQYGIYGSEIMGSEINYDEVRLVLEKTRRRDDEETNYCQRILTNMISQNDAINQININSEMSVAELRNNGLVPSAFVDIKEDIERVFQNVSDVGIGAFPIDDVDLKRYRRFIE